MRAWMRKRGGDICLLVFTVAVTLLLLEHVVFRHILVPDDVLPNVTINGVVRYKPGTAAAMRHPDGSVSRVTINDHGWNSTRRRYPVERKAGVARVAVIGDSYVHAGFVDVDKGFPEVIERELGSRGVAAEVYRFGMDGAPLSQYLHVLRREVLQLKPDVVVVQLIHNDFDESYRQLSTRYSSSFLKLAAEADGTVKELPPADFGPGLADRLRDYRTFRYLYYKTNLYLYLKALVSRFWWGGSEVFEPEFISSAVDIRKIKDHKSNRFFARYVLTEMKALAAEHGFALAFAMDGVREAIYSGKPLADYEVARLNRIAAKLTEKLELPFLDLHGVFAADYAAHRQRLEFPFDWHWNERGNALVGKAIADMLLSDGRLLARRVKVGSRQ